jgi:hypothetical protein
MAWPSGRRLDPGVAPAQSGRDREVPAATIRDPYVLEFLGLEGALPTEEQLRRWLLEEQEALARTLPPAAGAG